MEISGLWMARVQFALSLNFLVLFAALATALGWVLFFMRWRSIRHPEGGWQSAYRFWARIFALALIVAFGCAVPFLFELGVLWPSLFERIGNVAGPLLGASIVTFFIIKSVFLGVMLFGQKRASAIGHLFSVFMVALGLTVTVAWGIVLQAWSHTPSGATLIDGRYQVFDWIEVVFNASVGWHALLFFAGAGLLTAFLLLGVSAWQAYRRPLEDGEQATFNTAYWLAIVSLVLVAVATYGTERLIAKYRPDVASAIMGAKEIASAPLPTVSGQWLGRNADGTLRAIEIVQGEMAPHDLLYWPARLGLLLALGMAGVLMFLAWFRRKWGNDPSIFPPFVLKSSVWAAWAAIIVWLCLWNLIDLSRFPYLVLGTLTQADLVTDTDPLILLTGLAALSLCYGFLVVGFFSMLRHAARFGVVPVRKPGVRT